MGRFFDMDEVEEQGADVEVTREGILRLINRRKDIEEQIQALGGILESNRIGMLEPLVDNEGYPRNDINVYQVRHARHKIICLQNDFKTLTREIEAQLQAYHQQTKDRGTVDEVAMDVEEDGNGTSETRSVSPIAKVNLVSEGSPAFHAGLQVDDAIVEFGSINSQNFASLSDIGSLVQRSAGSVVSVKVKREAAILKLALIPGPWNGRGLLGCNIVPYEPLDR